MNRVVRGARAAVLVIACVPIANAAEQTPESRAAATEAAMTDAERVQLTIGIMPLPIGPGTVIPPDAISGAGYVPGVPRLGVPALKETDASLGVAFVSGLRHDGATPLPSGTALGSTWNPGLMQRAGAMIGGEARAKGFNVMLGGGVNLMRDPRNGRTFEYLGEDPLHSGLLAGAAVAGIQSNHIIATVKHFALNGQETARSYVDSRIADAAARESDLLAFQIAIEKGHPGSVMCAYNKVNGAQACGNDYLLNQVLKRDWGYKGFVMSDWGAVHAVDYALKGLDQQSGSNLDARPFFAEELRQAAATDPAYRERLRDMNRRILRAIYANGLDANPANPGGKVDREANLAIAEAAAVEGLVLLKNDAALPLSGNLRKIAVIGGFADAGILSGAGSSQVHLEGGAAATVSVAAPGPFAAMVSEQYHRSTPPLDAIRRRVPGAQVTFRNGLYVADAVQSARNADVVIVFANQWQSEGFDQPDLSLPRGQDALIEAVAAANPNTIVVLQTGSAVLMPWLPRVRGVLEAWYSGGRGGEAITKALFGDINPSGRLPISFPSSLQDLPRPVLDGSATVEPDFQGRLGNEHPLAVSYDIEGSNVGYRWFAARGIRTLFPFGFGLSYTRFTYSNLRLSGLTATVTVKNTGDRAGAAVPQIYLVTTPKGYQRRLAAFAKVVLQPGESREIALPLEPRIIAAWESAGWRIAAGRYEFAVGENAEALGEIVSSVLQERKWAP